MSRVPPMFPTPEYAQTCILAGSPVLTGMGDTGLEPVTSALSRRNRVATAVTSWPRLTKTPSKIGPKGGAQARWTACKFATPSHPKPGSCSHHVPQGHR